ncbi:mitochondrial 54S ribosomal protein YmL35 [Tilletia horrida]|nr:mitochondrial 54S ribosomal protein YmL35 [Tilletia horrida]
MAAYRTVRQKLLCPLYQAGGSSLPCSWISSSAPASAASASSASSSSSSPSSTPSTSSATGPGDTRIASQWKPALPPGREPAYDAALEFLKEHRNQQSDKDGVEAWVNDPEVLWKFAHDDVDLSQPVFRFLREKAWRQNGALDRLLERIRAMNVVPDVLPTIAPTVDVQVAYGAGSGIGDHGGEGGDVWPGVFVNTAKTLSPPQLTVTPFHAEVRKYTILMVDPDVPNELSASFDTFVHWHVSNVPLSATQTSVSAVSANELQAYIPPHPQDGSPYHRYTTVVFEQTGEAAPAALSARTLSPAAVQKYVQENSLRPVGIHFFRQICKDKETKRVVETIYRDTLGREAPTYGNLPKSDPFRDSAGYRHSRYFESADELAAQAI